MWKPAQESMSQGRPILRGKWAKVPTPDTDVGKCITVAPSRDVTSDKSVSVRALLSNFLYLL